MEGADNPDERMDGADNLDERTGRADNPDERIEGANNLDERMEGADNPDTDFGGNPKKNSKSKEKNRTKNATGILSGAPSDEVYSTSKKRMGKCIIFNHKSFTCGLDERPDTDKDMKALEKFFEEYKFEVKVHNDKKVQEIYDILSEVENEDHEDENCFVCCVLTHGDFKKRQHQEVLYAKDSYYPTERLFTPFLGDRCRSLAGKPKIFFIQACRGDKMDDGINVFFKIFNVVRAQSYPFISEPLLACKIPLHSDFLIAQSSVSGFYAWKRFGEGSWFIQTLCETLQERAEDLDLLSILTIVCRKVAYGYESITPDEPDMHHKKQTPSVYSTLTRWIKFNKKQNSPEPVVDSENPPKG